MVHVEFPKVFNVKRLFDISGIGDGCCVGLSED